MCAGVQWADRRSQKPLTGQRQRLQQRGSIDRFRGEAVWCDRTVVPLVNPDQSLAEKEDKFPPCRHLVDSALEVQDHVLGVRVRWSVYTGGTESATGVGSASAVSSVFG